MMKINNIQLYNYHGFKSVTIDFNPKVTCLAGINGAGKSSVLNAIALCLSWIIARIKNPKGQGWFANAYEDARYGEMYGGIQSIFSFFDKEIFVKQGFAVNGVVGDIKSDYSTLNFLFDYVSTSSIAYDIPTLVYYPINRVVLDIPLRIRMKHSFNQFSAYDNALDSSARFRDFFEWYRDREDIENAEINNRKDFNYKDSILESVRNAIYSFLPGYTNLHIQRAPQMMMITKGADELPVNALSDGEKCLLSLVGDLARRLSLANPAIKNPLEGSGIVLIDEIELHLHPSWQRKVCKALKETFPNCQFIITTHSPQVLGELKTEEIWLLNDFNVYRPDSSYGLTSNEILDEIMDVIDDDTSLSRDSEIAKKLNEVSTLVELEEFNAAKKVIEEIEKITGGEIHETVKYKTVIEMIGED